MMGEENWSLASAFYARGIVKKFSICTWSLSVTSCETGRLLCNNHRLKNQESLAGEGFSKERCDSPEILSLAAYDPLGSTQAIGRVLETNQKYSETGTPCRRPHQ